MNTQSPRSPPKTIRTTVRKLIKKMQPAKEEPMPGELDPTEVQLARFFAKPAPHPMASPGMRRDQASPTSSSSSSLSPASSTASAASSSPRGPMADLARRRAPFSSDAASDAFGMVQCRD